MCWPAGRWTKTPCPSGFSTRRYRAIRPRCSAASGWATLWPNIIASAGGEMVEAVDAAGPSSPGDSLIQAADGKFYGTTSGGGAFSAGTVFKMDGAGTVIVLHSFSDADG